MSYFLSVESDVLILRKGNLKTFIDSISIQNADADIWILKHKSHMEESDSLLFSSSVHWDFVSKNKSMGYALSDETEIIINQDKMEQDGEKYIRLTDKGGLIFKKNNDGIFFLIDHYLKE